jgi:hypothetical protein
MRRPAKNLQEPVIAARDGAAHSGTHSAIGDTKAPWAEPTAAVARPPAA